MTFDITKKWRWLVALGAVFVPAIVTGAGSVKVPHKFAAGSAIKAQEMNDNISSLKKAIDGKGAVASTAIGTLTISTLVETIEIRRFSQKLSNPTTLGGGGGGAARPIIGPIEVSFRLGNNSPQLNAAVNAGTIFQTANFAMGNFLIRLEDLILTSITADDTVDGVNGVPLQELAIDFTRIEWIWQPAGQASRSVTWDRGTNQGGGSGPGDGTTEYAYFASGATSNPQGIIPITGYFTDQRCPNPTPPGSGTGGCRVAHSPFGIGKVVFGVDVLDDLANVTQGELLQSADIQWRVPGDTGPETIQHRTRLENYIVSAVDISTGTNGNLVESIGMTYARIQWTVGNRQTGWDVAAGTPF
jgi:type VI protein secretion system component Hcp